MRTILCKIFQFLLSTLQQVVEVVASAIKSIGHAVVDVLSDLWDNTLGSGSLGGIFTFAILGIAAWWLLSSKDDEQQATKPLSLEVKSEHT